MQTCTRSYIIDFVKFFYVYVLQSLKFDFTYIGYTENLKERLEIHNAGKNTSTKPYAPYELIHFEGYKNIKDAKRKETYLKCNRRKTTLKVMLKEYFSNPH